MKFQLDYVLDFPKPQDALDALKRLPIEMESAHFEIMEKIEKAKWKPTALKALSWIFLARRLLSIDELREAISIRPSRHTQLSPKLFVHPDALVRYCQGPIGVDEQNNVVCFTHYTVQEFLRAKYRDKMMSNIDIAKVCLTYLNFDVFERRSSKDEKTLIARVNGHKFLEYAFVYWGDHIKRGIQNDEELVRLQ